MFGMIGFGVIEILAFLFLLPVCLLGTIFWVWMLVDCATKESNQGSDKIVCERPYFDQGAVVRALGLS